MEIIKLRLILISFISCHVLNSCGGPDNTVVTPRPVASDGGTAKEQKMAGLLRGHSKQRRKMLIYNARLTSVARARAKDMARRNYFGHVDPDGYGPNWHLTRTGYRLPIEWTAFKNANQVESILGGKPTAEGAFHELVNSSGHRSHLLASAPFYENHLCYGVGYAFNPASTYHHYWVIITAPIEK
ncbi:CAP domain-containing protein [Akkermansiaceae bacterium]|nr:CAP domain-containing protein [Akkermansiaceae bacterium]MDB4537648.1 CAP domain-containing protein [Akkermansiaceae bacterium]